ncbi:MAG: RAMP superfamily CRISPR-associated protein [Promethearchaeota archaeon]
MSEKKKKKVTDRVKRIRNPQRVLKVVAYTAIAKPLNGSLPRSNKSHFLRLYPVSYAYKSGKEEKEAQSETYFIKGLRGAIRHQVMQTCYDAGLDVCHTSDKEFDKEGNRLLPRGFHLLGQCKGNGECIMHQVFGSKGNEGLISVYAEPISSINHKSAITENNVQTVHIATENRVCISFDGKAIQDFGERYFSGEFSFEIDVTRCNTEQLGLLLESVINLEKLGRGYNSGYGKLKIVRLQLLERTTKKHLFWKDEDFIVQEERSEKSLKKEVLEAMEAFHVFVNTERENKNANSN